MRASALLSGAVMRGEPASWAAAQGALHSMRWSTFRLSPIVWPMPEKALGNTGIQVGTGGLVAAVENLVDHGDHPFRS